MGDNIPADPAMAMRFLLGGGERTPYDTDVRPPASALQQSATSTAASAPAGTRLAPRAGPPDQARYIPGDSVTESGEALQRLLLFGGALVVLGYLATKMKSTSL